MPVVPLSKEESLFYRDQLRAARYTALADAEGFAEICFAVEALGMRLLGKQAVLSRYKSKIQALIYGVTAPETLPQRFPGCFSSFEALYNTLNKARNDVMHTGAYARHATSAAIELCIHLEEAVMTSERTDSQEDISSMKVRDYMVKEVVSLKEWHPVAYARKLMLTHSFSFLPVFVNNRWALVSELAIAQYLQVSLTKDSQPPEKPSDARREERSRRLALPIRTAIGPNDPDFPKYCEPQLLKLWESPVELEGDLEIKGLFKLIDASMPTLWLVLDKDPSSNQNQPKRLAGVLTPFELM